MRRTKGWRQGLYTPRHPEKYIGDLGKIMYRSSWELECFQFLDNNINVYAWASEPFPIPYIKPTDKKPHKYYPDFYVQYKNKRGDVIREVLEIKPKKQTQPSTSRNRKTRLTEDLTYAINRAKWEAAISWCNKRNLSFRVIGETDMFRS